MVPSRGFPSSSQPSSWLGRAPGCPSSILKAEKTGRTGSGSVSQRGSHQVHGAPTVPFRNVSFNLKDSDTEWAGSRDKGTSFCSNWAGLPFLSHQLLQLLGLLQQQVQLGLQSRLLPKGFLLLLQHQLFLQNQQLGLLQLLLEELSHSVHIPGPGTQVRVRCCCATWVSPSNC